MDSISCCLFVFSCSSADPRDLHSFPTRRSSDLPKRTFISIITLVSVLGVTLGVTVLILVISVMTGFDRELRQKVIDRKSTRLNSSHTVISYAVFCLKKKKELDQVLLELDVMVIL